MITPHGLVIIFEVHNEYEPTTMRQLSKGSDEMKRFLAVTLVVLMSMVAGLAEQLKPNSETTVNKAVAAKAASSLKVKPALAASGATAGYFPWFTDTSGDLGNSALFQVNTGTTTYLGFGTTTPSFNLHFVSQVDPAAIAIDGYGTVGINFIGRRAEGTLAHPTALLADDNIMAMQGRGFGSTTFSPYSRAYMKFFAAENWSDAAQGTYISLATTTKGTSPNASATERMRITDAGFVGIGTTSPNAMLEVNGTAQFDGVVSFASGQTFPGTGLSISSPDGSITVGGTATAPTVAVNPLVLQTAIGASGTAVSVAVKVAQASFIGSFGLGSTNTIYTAKADGFYRVSVYMNVPTYGTCSSAPCSGEAVTIQWNDGVSTTALATANCNLVTPCGSSAVIPIWVKSGQTITAYGQSYGSGTAPAGGTYNAYVLVEQL